MEKRVRLLNLVVLAILLMSGYAQAADDRLDLRHTRVARISLLEGDALLRTASAEDLGQPLVNLPLATGDQVSTSARSRLEFQLHGAIVRLGENSSLEVTEIAADRYIFNLQSGTATFIVDEDWPRHVEVIAQQLAVKIRKEGVYRINVSASLNSEVIVHRGEAEVVGLIGQCSPFKLREGRRASARATDPDDIEIVAINTYDDWDSWNQERDQILSAHNYTRKYVGRSAYGHYDLDRYGNWVNVSRYGWVWRPNGIGSGWAPFRFGRWVHYRNWGWTWVSYEPWGWLPYHYGYWTYLAGQGWVWVPDSIDWFWSPARVSWYYVPWNTGNYVGWRPYNPNYGGNGWTNNAPTTPRPLTPVGPGQPVKHPRGRDIPIDDPNYDDGVTILDVSDFLKGGKPRTATPEIIQRIREVKTIESSGLPRPGSPGGNGLVGNPVVGDRNPNPSTKDKEPGSHGNQPRNPAGSSGNIGNSLTPGQGPFGGSTPTPIGRPRPEPSDKGVRSPIERPIERPVDRPVERPKDRQLERERGNDRPIEKRIDKPADRPVERPAERPREHSRPSQESRPAPAPRQDSTPAPAPRMDSPRNNDGGGGGRGNRGGKG